MSKTKKEKLRLATWNINRSKKQTQIMSFFKTLSEYEIDIACLQETALTEGGNFKNSTYTILYSGKPKADMRKFHGVGLVVRRDLLKQLQIKELPPEIEERLMYCQLKTSVGRIHIINVYSPTEKNESVENEKFYEDLEEIVLKVPKSESVFIAGDFNGHLGAENEAWTTCMGQYGVGTVNYNGLRLLEFCTFHNLCITNTYVKLEDNEKVTHSSKENWHQLDLIVTRKRDLQLIDKIETCGYFKHTDHCMVICYLSISQNHKSDDDTLIKPNTDNSVGQTNCDEMLSFLKIYFSEHLLTKPKPNRDMKINWSDLKKCIASLNQLHDDQQLKDFKIFHKKFKISIVSFKNALSRYLESDDKKNLQHFMGEKKSVRKIVLGYLQNTGLNKNFEDEILKELDKCIVNLETFIYDEKTEANKLNLKLDWSQFKQLPSRKNLNDGINIAENQNELCGITGMRKRNIQTFFRENKQIIHSFLIACWKSGHVPTKMFYTWMRYATLCNVKPSRDIHVQVISLMFNALRNVIMIQLNVVKGNAKHVLNLPQITLNKLHFEADTIMSIKKLQDEFRKKEIPFYIAFVDLSEVLTKIKRRFLLNFLLSVGCSETLVGLISYFILEKEDNSVLNLQLFDIFWNYITNTYLEKYDAIRMKSEKRNKTYQDLYLHGLYCGEKAVIFANSKDKLKQHLENIEQGLKHFGITIFTCNELKKPSIQILGKTKSYNSQQEFLTIDSKTFHVQGIVHFCGVIFANSIPLEIQFIIHQATRKMAEQSLSNASKSKNEKIKFYKEQILRELLRQCGYLTRNDVQEYQLNHFHIKSLRRLLCKKAESEDSSQVLKAAGLESIQELLKQMRRNKWSKIKIRNDNDLTKSILYGELVIK